MALKNQIMVASLFSAAVLVSMSAPAFANDNVDVELRYWNPSLTAQSKLKADPASVDFKNELGLGDKNATDFRVTVGDEKKMRLAYTKFNYSGNRTETGTIQYNGKNYDYSAGIASNLDIDYYRLSLIRPLAHTQAADVDWMIDLKGLTFKGKLNGIANGTNVTTDKSFTGVIPTVGFAVSTKTPNAVNAYAEVSGLPLASYGYIYDYEGGVKYQPTSNFTLTAGYRVFDMKLKNDDEWAKLKLSGPFFSADWKF